MDRLNISYKIRFGSHAYGVSTEDSDLDIRGIYLPTLEEFLSLKELKDYEDKDNDIIIYPINKFFKLAAKSNPSVIEWLFVDEKDILEITELGREIRDNRDLFLSQEIYFRFKGYAISEFNALQKLSGDTGEKRRQQILKYGYNIKSAVNVIRILEEAIEILGSGNLILPLINREKLFEIKSGVWSYVQVCEKFERLLKVLDNAYENSKLPEKCDFEKVDGCLISLLKRYC